MILIVEDGTKVTGANSYASADDLFQYASERNIEVPNDAVQLEGLLLKAMDYLETLTDKFKGIPKFTDQALPFPRTVVNDYYQTIDLGVPAALKKAQIVAAISAITNDLMPVQTGREMDTVRETVGPITVEYEKGYSGRVARIPQVDALLRPFFIGGFGQPTIIRG